MLALTSITGKLGNATLSAIIKHSLIPPSSLVLCTSSDTNSPRWDDLKSKGAQVRPFNFDDPDPATFAGCTKLFLVSTPRISLDFKSQSGKPGPGRETQHIPTIRAAQKAGVGHVYYTSLAFGSESRAGVMRAHLRTEEFLHGLEGEGMKFTILREGLYNESWPLYLGYYDVKGGDDRSEIVLAGDGKISWTSIGDLGLGNALIIADEDEGKWEGKTVYLSKTSDPRTLKEIAGLVEMARRRELQVKTVGEQEYVDFYAGRGKEREAVEWWSSTYPALEKGECEIRDATLDGLLEKVGVKARPVEETIQDMLRDYSFGGI